MTLFYLESVGMSAIHHHLLGETVIIQYKDMTTLCTLVQRLFTWHSSIIAGDCLWV